MVGASSHTLLSCLRLSVGGGEGHSAQSLSCNISGPKKLKPAPAHTPALSQKGV